MTTQYKITRSDITASASQNLEQMEGIEQTLDRMDAHAAGAHTSFRPRIDVALDKMRHNIVPELSVSIIAEAYDETAAERDRLRKQMEDHARGESEYCEAFDRATSKISELKNELSNLQHDYSIVSAERNALREQVKTLLVIAKQFVWLDAHEGTSVRLERDYSLSDGDGITEEGACYIDIFNNARAAIASAENATKESEPDDDEFEINLREKGKLDYIEGLEAEIEDQRSED